MNKATTKGFHKPINLRAIFILNALKIILSISLYFGFKYNALTIGTMSSAESAIIILYTAFGYIFTFSIMVACILKRQILGLRLAIVADFLISIPAKAYLGILIAIISMALTFTASVKRYFSQEQSSQLKLKSTEN